MTTTTPTARLTFSHNNASIEVDSQLLQQALMLTHVGLTSRQEDLHRQLEKIDLADPQGAHAIFNSLLDNHKHAGTSIAMVDAINKAANKKAAAISETVRQRANALRLLADALEERELTGAGVHRITIDEANVATGAAVQLARLRDTLKQAMQWAAEMNATYRPNSSPAQWHFDAENLLKA